MAGRHRDPLRPVTVAVVGLVLTVGVAILVCYAANVPPGLWERP